MLDGVDQVGRVNTAVQVRRALGIAGCVDNRRLRHAFEMPARGRAILASVKAFVAGLLTARPLPLQCALFAASAGDFTFEGEQRNGCDVVYLDGIRALLLMRRLRSLVPQVRIIVDLDDLMSRRFDHLRRSKTSLSLGYLEKAVPKWLPGLLVGNYLGRLIVSYELMALRHAEREVARNADSVILVNAREVEMLRARLSAAETTPSENIVAIRPPAEARRGPSEPVSSLAARDLRAIFIGSDVLVQNRTTIAYLLRLWENRKIKTKLCIYGRQRGDWRSVANVEFMGYVPDIKVAYEAGSVMLYPCFVPGGIKTKVLEAFSYGTPVIGNSLSFEGILPAHYPLVIDDEEELVALLDRLPDHRQVLDDATAKALKYLQQEHSVRLFQQRWRSTIRGCGASA